jgi:hypothetical protein
VRTRMVWTLLSTALLRYLSGVREAVFAGYGV